MPTFGLREVRRFRFRWRPASCCSPMSRASRRRELCRQARLSAGRSAGVFGARRRQSGGGAGAGLSRRRRAVAIRRQRPGRRKTPLALVVCSATLAICLLFLTGLLTNLPKAVLAAIVFTAVYKMVDVAALLRMWRISRIDFYAAAIALVSVLLLGILQGILLAAVASILLLLARASQPNIAFLGRAAGNRPLCRQCAQPRCRAAHWHHRVPPRGVAALHQCRNRPRNGAGQGRRGAGHEAGRLRSFVLALHRSGGRKNAARPPRRTRFPWNRSADRRRPRAGPRCP